MDLNRVCVVSVWSGRVAGWLLGTVSVTLDSHSVSTAKQKPET